MKKLMMMPAIHVAAMMAAVPGSVLGPVVMDVGDEELLKQVHQQISELNGKTKETAENALKQAKDAGEVSAETKAVADKLLTQQAEANKLMQSLTDKLEGVEAKQLEVAQHIAEGGGKGGGSSRMSLGSAVVNEKEKLAQFSAGGGGKLVMNVQNAITTAAGSAGGLIYNEEERDPVRLPRRRLLIRDLLMQGMVNSDLVKYRRQTVRNSQAAMVAEGAASAASTYGWEKATAEVKKIAHHSNISEEAMSDADQLESEIDGEMRYGLDLEEERQILAGDGVGENLEGLLTGAAAFAAAAGLPNANRIDRLRLAFLQITLEDYYASTAVLSATDWAAIEMHKVNGADDRYVYGNPGISSMPMLWGRDVVETNSMSSGEWLVGDFMMAATYYDRNETEVIISSEHDTNFVEDMLTIKARKRVALAIKRSLAMVRGDFTFA